MTTTIIQEPQKVEIWEIGMQRKELHNILASKDRTVPEQWVDGVWPYSFYIILDPAVGELGR